jgi:hypothetical protein
MIHLQNLNHPELFSELSVQEAADIKGGQQNGENGTTGQNGQNGTGQFNQQKYLQALGIAYLSPPGIGEITDKEAMLAQYVGWDNS